MLRLQDGAGVVEYALDNHRSAILGDWESAISAFYRRANDGPGWEPSPDALEEDIGAAQVPMCVLRRFF